MKAIHQYLPDPRHAEAIRIFVNAQPAEAWQAVRHFDASTIPWVRMLFDIRTLPDILSGKARKSNHRLGIDQITESGSGFFIAKEIPGREVVIASVGQFWHLNIPFAPVKPENFASFHEPGWGKLVWGFSIEPYRDGTTICLELRTTATDEESWKKLDRYYQVIGIGSKLIRHSGMERLEEELGKMIFPDEDKISVPGDRIIPESKYSITYGINIEAPTEIVWDYLMQLGCDRAGWYSLDTIDHGGVPSTNHRVAEWKTRQVNDRISATPAQDDFFVVYEIEDKKSFVIGGEAERMGGPFRMTWSFILQPIGENATRLMSRARMTASIKWAEWFMGSVVYPPVHGLMSGVQLKTIKKYAERDALSVAPIVQVPEHLHS